MKPILCLLPLLLLCSCMTKLDCNAGTYSTMGDNTDVTIKASKGQITYYHAGSNVHTPVTKANWHGFGVIAADATAFAAGPVPGVAVTAATQMLNRPTSRPIPATPVIVTKP